MSFAPPPGPPPPSVPDGWKAQYDDRYQQWYFVNLHTGMSQWEQPEAAPTQPQADQLQGPPTGGPPPSYEDAGQPAAAAADTADTSAAASEKKAFGSNNPYNSQAGTSEDTVESDARLAARLQAEENARSNSHSPAVQPGAASDYYQDNNTVAGGPAPGGLSPAPQTDAPVRGTKGRSRSFLSKLIGKKTGSSGGSPAYGRPPPAQPYGFPQGYQQQGGGYYGGYAAQPQPGYGYGGGYPQYPMQGGGRPQRLGGGGMGMGGAAALGVGGGLLGGAMLANSFDHGDTYNTTNNYDSDGGGGGDDYGGGDGGDFGGGDFGGGDF